jgi:hypothetical protein
MALGPGDHTLEMKIPWQKSISFVNLNIIFQNVIVTKVSNVQSWGS